MEIEPVDYEYELPKHWVLDDSSLFGVEYFAYLDIVQQALKRKSLDVLDVGCGDGRLSAELLRRGHRVVGVDKSERGLGFARLMSPHGDFRSADLTADGLSAVTDRTFDAIVMVEVIEHLPPHCLDRLLGDARRLLRPDGMLIVSAPSIRLPINEYHYQHFTQEGLQSLVRAADFEVERTIYQHRLGWPFTTTTYHLLQNRYYDLTLIRKILKRVYKAWFAVSDAPELVGRFIVTAVPRGAMRGTD